MRRNISSEEVCILVLFFMGSCMVGCLRPNWHWSKNAGFVRRHVSSNSTCCHIPDGAGFSKWKWSPRSSWIRHSSEQNSNCSLEISWSCWMRQKDVSPRIWLNLFHGDQGPHSGAIQICRGLQRKTFLNSWTCPWNVLRSPSSKVKRLAVPPFLMTSSVSLLCGLA